MSRRLSSGPPVKPGHVSQSSASRCAVACARTSPLPPEICYCSYSLLFVRQTTSRLQNFAQVPHLHRTPSPPRCCLARIKQRPFSNACSVNNHSLFGDF